jgi:hypothetical protein
MRVLRAWLVLGEDLLTAGGSVSSQNLPSNPMEKKRRVAHLLAG